MSLILDALKRSEAQRHELNQSPTGLIMHPDQKNTRRGWVLWGLLAILAFNLLALALLYFKPPASGEAPTPNTPEKTISNELRVNSPAAQEPASTIPAATTTTKPPVPLSAALPRPPRRSEVSASLAPEVKQEKKRSAQHQTDEVSDAPENVRDYASRLELNTVVYSDKPEKSFALINMKKYRNGDALPGNGYAIDRITPEGVVIRHNDGLVLLRAQ
ncbi:MAG: general secretion pathway protein GspB [Thiotrichales bacterium]